MECGYLSPLWPRRQNESGDKSPHSKKSRDCSSASHQKAAPEASRTSNYTRSPWTSEAPRRS